LAPGEVCAKELLNCSHKVNVDEIRQDALELFPNFVAARKVDEVTNIQSHCDWNSGVLIG
jgi:hypothetical protein